MPCLSCAALTASNCSMTARVGGFCPFIGSTKVSSFRCRRNIFDPSAVRLRMIHPQYLDTKACSPSGAMQETSALVGFHRSTGTPSVGTGMFLLDLDRRRRPSIAVTFCCSAEQKRSDHES